MDLLRQVCALGVSVLLLGGCATKPPSEVQASQTPEYVIAPLTGIQYLAGTPEAVALEQPAVACKIDNSEAARPQLNLNRTDLVFDEMVEGGLTRFVAIWQSDLPDAVGPVRSIRPMDPDILSPFGGIVCYSGGQVAFTNEMKKTNVFNASETSEQGQGTFARSKDREAPHNVIVNVKKLASNHTDISAPTVQFEHAESLASSSAQLSGTLAATVRVNFPSAIAEWSADAISKLWLRNQDGKPHLDAATGKQITAANIVVLETQIDRSYLDRKYGNVPRTVMVAKGKAWVFSGSNRILGTWSKASRISPIVIQDQAGATIQLAPGNTWVELMPMAPEGKLIIK